MPTNSIIPANLKWLHVGPDFHGNPALEYAIDTTGEYVYERSQLLEGSYQYRRALWTKVLESSSPLNVPMGIWEQVQ